MAYSFADWIDRSPARPRHSRGLARVLEVAPREVQARTPEELVQRDAVVLERLVQRALRAAEQPRDGLDVQAGLVQALADHRAGALAQRVARAQRRDGAALLEQRDTHLAQYRVAQLLRARVEGPGDRLAGDAAHAARAGKRAHEQLGQGRSAAENALARQQEHVLHHLLRVAHRVRLRRVVDAPGTRGQPRAAALLLEHAAARALHHHLQVAGVAEARRARSALDAVARGLQPAQAQLAELEAPELPVELLVAVGLRAQAPERALHEIA